MYSAGLSELALQPSTQVIAESIQSGLESLSQLVIGHGPYISFFSAVMALVCVLFLLFPSEGHRLVGRWVKYVGLAFFTLFLLHALRRLFGLYVHDSVRPLVGFESYVESCLDVVLNILSIINNLLFLAAARILLNKERPFKIIPLRSDAGRLERAKVTFLGTLNELWAALPRWALAVALITLVAAFENFNIVPARARCALPG